MPLSYALPPLLVLVHPAKLQHPGVPGLGSWNPGMVVVVLPAGSPGEGTVRSYRGAQGITVGTEPQNVVECPPLLAEVLWILEIQRQALVRGQGSSGH